MVSQRKDKTFYSVIGVMAGSSMDGLDIAYVIFEKSGDVWKYQLEKCEVVPYPTRLYQQLKSSATQPRNIQKNLDIEFGKWIAACANRFKDQLPTPDLLGVHGHTVIHDPSNQISCQLGDGPTIASKTGLTTVTEFRTQDIHHGGQGAPLVPLGDFTLFSEFDACLNLGGIANISLKANATAWDICPCNQVLNYFANRLGKPFDANGDFARSGKLDSRFHSQISALPFFTQPTPKSLPNNFIDTKMLTGVDPLNGLHTYSQIIGEQVQKSLENARGSKLLVTGGGAFNGFLIEMLRTKIKDWNVVVPEKEIIEFKESLVFAFLALRRSRNEINVLASVTGASKDSSSGVIHLP